MRPAARKCAVLVCAALLGEAAALAAEKSGSGFHFPLSGTGANPVDYLEAGAQMGEGGDLDAATWENAEMSGRINEDLKDARPFLVAPRETAVRSAEVIFQWNRVRKGDALPQAADVPGEQGPATRYRLRVRTGSVRGKILWETETPELSVPFAGREPLASGTRYFWHLLAADAADKLLHSSWTFFRILNAAQLAEVTRAEAAFAPTSLEAYFQLMAVLQKFNLADDLYALTERGAKQFPEASSFLEVKGEILRRKGQFLRAEAAFRKATQLDPENLHAWHGRIAAQWKVSAFEGELPQFLSAKAAVRQMARVVTAQPKNAIAHANYARALQLASETGGKEVRSQIVAQLREAIALAPENALFHLSLAKALREKRETADDTKYLYSRECLAELARFVTLFCRDLDSRYYYLSWHEVTNDLEEAVGVLIEQKAHLAEVAAAVAMLERLGVNDYALRWMHYQLAKCAEELGQLSEAVARMEQVVAIDRRQGKLPEDKAWTFPLENDLEELKALQKKR